MRLIVIFAVFIFAGVVSAPSRCMTGALEGLSLCAKVIIPSLFPFFVCAKLFVMSGIAQRLGRWMSVFMRPVFNVPGSAGFAFIMGILSGYPVGAQCGVDLYRQGLCTKTEAQRIICFCNNSGPLFVIGAVGAGMLYSHTAGITLYIIHVLSAITVGIIFRWYKKSESVSFTNATHKKEVQQTGFGEAVSSAISQSVELILYVCGFIVFFSVFVSLLEHVGIMRFLQNFLYRFGISKNVSSALATGFFEVSKGAMRLCALPIGSFRGVLVSMVVAWSGVSVILQVSGIISKTELDIKIFILAKLLHSIIAGIYAMIAARLPIGAVQTFSGGYASDFNPWVMSLPFLAIAISLYALIALGSYLICRKLRKAH